MVVKRVVVRLMLRVGVVLIRYMLKFWFVRVLMFVLNSLWVLFSDSCLVFVSIGLDLMRVRCVVWLLLVVGVVLV